MSWWNPPGQASWVKSIHHLGFQKLAPHSACNIQNQNVQARSMEMLQRKFPSNHFKTEMVSYRQI